MSPRSNVSVSLMFAGNVIEITTVNEHQLYILMYNGILFDTLDLKRCEVGFCSDCVDLPCAFTSPVCSKENFSQLNLSYWTISLVLSIVLSLIFHLVGSLVVSQKIILIILNWHSDTYYFWGFGENVPRFAKHLMNLDQSSIQVLNYKTQNRYWNQVTNRSTTAHAQMKQTVFGSVIPNPSREVWPRRKLPGWKTFALGIQQDKIDTVQAHILRKVKEVRSLQDLARSVDFLPLCK